MSVNKVILIGNVGNDPEVRYIEQNVPVANFRLATTDRGYTTQNGTTVPERTEWHNIVVWRGLAKVVESYVKKGSPLYIEGKLRSRSWEDQNGVRRYITEIYAENLELLGRRSDSGQASPQPPQSAQADQAQTQQAQPQSSSQFAPMPEVPPEEDDLPF